MARKAVALISGGLDSAVAAAEARAEGFEIHALSVHYGQRHDAEVEAARAIAGALECAGHREISVDLASFGGSALTDPLAPLPHDRAPGEIGEGIPSTYVLAAFEALAKVATKAGVEGEAFRIHAPLLRMTKQEIVRRGVALGVDLGLTRSCYDLDPWGRACGHCDACLLRRKGFEGAGVEDPTEYQ